MVEASIAGLLAAGLGLGELTATAAQFAAALFSVSFAGLVVLLVSERRLRRKWEA